MFIFDSYRIAKDSIVVNVILWLVDVMMEFNTRWFAVVAYPFLVRAGWEAGNVAWAVIGCLFGPILAHVYCWVEEAWALQSSSESESIIIRLK